MYIYTVILITNTITSFVQFIIAKMLFFTFECYLKRKK